MSGIEWEDAVMDDQDTGRDRFDTNRNAPHIKALQGRTKLVSDFGTIPIRIDDTGVTVDLPLRQTVSQDLGEVLELGPFSISCADACTLREVLDAFILRTQWSTGRAG